jgi:hypothetical protein
MNAEERARQALEAVITETLERAQGQGGHLGATARGRRAATGLAGDSASGGGAIIGDPAHVTNPGDGTHFFTLGVSALGGPDILR